MDSLKQIAEDSLLLAARIRQGESLEEESYVTDEGDPEEMEAMRQWRIVELVVNLGERIAETAGLSLDEAWVPEPVKDLV